MTRADWHAYAGVDLEPVVVSCNFRPASIPNLSKPELIHCDTQFDYSNDKPRLAFAEGGRYLHLSFARSPAADWNAEMFPGRGGVRGRCKGFSFGSRRRMLNRLNSISVAAKLPQFFTATLPDDVFNDDVAEFAKLAKHWLDSFVKRLRRRLPDCSGFWRIEWQSRKSGEHEGKLFPHFHLLVWGLPERVLGEREEVDDEGRVVGIEEVREAFVPCPDYQLSLDLLATLSEDPAKGSTELGQGERRSCIIGAGGKVEYSFRGKWRYVERCVALHGKVMLAQSCPDSPRAVELGRNMSFADWASLNWYHVVGSGNTDHLKAGVRVERVRTWGGVMSYCAKYMAKSDSSFLAEIEFGRNWGIFNRASVPWAKMVELDLDTDVAVRLRRVARRYLERRFDRRVLAPYGITLYCDVEKFRRLWECSPPDPF